MYLYIYISTCLYINVALQNYMYMYDVHNMCSSIIVRLNNIVHVHKRSIFLNLAFLEASLIPTVNYMYCQYIVCRIIIDSHCELYLYVYIAGKWCDVGSVGT